MADYPGSRIERLLDRIEPRLRLEFLALIGLLEEENSLDDLELLLLQGRFEEALAGLARAAGRLSVVWSASYVAAGRDAAEWLDSLQGIVFDFDQTNVRAVEAMRLNRLRLVREFSAGQREATRMALLEGIARGDNPRQQARNFRRSIGLSVNQQRAVDNYRRALETGDRAALQRALRDRRFDRTVARAARGDLDLSPEQIDRMVQRYRDRAIKHRAEVIARTEALRAVHEGNHEAFQQAIDVGEIDGTNLVQVWNTAGDTRVRDTHRSMSGQEQPFGEPFISPSGARLRHPGDINAPGSETIQCRCALGTRIPDLEGVESFEILAVEEA